MLCFWNPDHAVVAKSLGEIPTMSPEMGGSDGGFRPVARICLRNSAR